MRLAITATIVLWALIFGLILLCFPDFSFAEKRVVIKIRTYYKPGYQSVSPEWARAMHRIALRRTEKVLPVRFSHTFREIPATIAPHEREYVGCYRIADFENGACCPTEYLSRHWEQTEIWKRAPKYQEVSMIIAPPTGANSAYGGSWLTGGIAFVGCWHWKPSMLLGIVNATEINMLKEARRYSGVEVYRHELMHAAFNAYHIENEWNIMKTFSPEYNRVEAETAGELGLPISKTTIKTAMRCIKQRRRGE